MFGVGQTSFRVSKILRWNKDPVSIHTSRTGGQQKRKTRKNNFVTEGPTGRPTDGRTDQPTLSATKKPLSLLPGLISTKKKKQLFHEISTISSLYGLKRESCVPRPLSIWHSLFLVISMVPFLKNISRRQIKQKLVVCVLISSTAVSSTILLKSITTRWNTVNSNINRYIKHM